MRRCLRGRCRANERVHSAVARESRCCGVLSLLLFPRSHAWHWRDGSNDRRPKGCRKIRQSCTALKPQSRRAAALWFEPCTAVVADFVGFLLKQADEAERPEHDQQNNEQNPAVLGDFLPRDGPA